MNLYQITAELMGVIDILENNEEGFSDEQAKELFAIKAGSKEQLEQKILDYAYVIKNKQADSKTLTSEIKSLGEKKKVTVNIIDRMKETILEVMQEFGIKKIADPILKVNYVEHKTKKLQVRDIDKLPPEFIISEIVRRPNQNAIDEHYKKYNKELPGTEEVRTKFIQIK